MTSSRPAFPRRKFNPTLQKETFPFFLFRLRRTLVLSLAGQSAKTDWRVIKGARLCHSIFSSFFCLSIQLHPFQIAAFFLSIFD